MFLQLNDQKIVTVSQNAKHSDWLTNFSFTKFDN